MVNVNSILTAKNHKLPAGTQIRVSMSQSKVAHLHVELKLPGQDDFSDLGDLPIVDGIVTLPMKLVFLLHAKEDRSVVKGIGEKLRQDGFLTWFDENDLLPGDKWKDLIETAIEKSDFIQVFLSARSIVKTGYVQHEMCYALEQQNLRPSGQRYIIPVLTEPCVPPKAFRDIHWLELWKEDAYDKIRKAM